MVPRFVRLVVFILPVLLMASIAFAKDKQALNGTWVLEPTRSQFAGEPVIQTGTVTIADRQHNIYISRTYNFDGESGGFSYQSSTDGRENSAIHQGKTIKTKARYESGDLMVTTTENGIATSERYHLNPDGTMTMTVDRPGHHTLVLFFERQS